MVSSACLVCNFLRPHFGPYLAEVMSAQWVTADQGGARFSLYSHGLDAWMYSPFTILFGNGAGLFFGSRRAIPNERSTQYDY